MKRPMRLEIYREDRDDYVFNFETNGIERVGTRGWRWRIRATNGRILADSGEAYRRLRDCAHGAELVLEMNFDGNPPTPGTDRMIETGRYQGWRITVQP